MEYTKSILIFIDILGFKEHINRTTKSESKNHIEDINSLFDEIDSYYTLCKDSAGVGQILPKSLTITTFSDSIVVSFNSNEFSHFFDVIYSVAKYINIKAIEKGFLLRGVIVEGDIFQTTNKIFGPALIEAYELETKASIYPRIIISEEILSKKLRAESSDKRTISDFNKNTVYQIDFDGMGYIDYLSNVNGILQDNADTILEYYKKVSLIIDDGLKVKSKDVRIKYSWLNEKFKLSPEVIQLKKEHKL